MSVHHCEWRVRSGENGFSKVCYEILRCHRWSPCRVGWCRGSRPSYKSHHGGYRKR
ncbi:hypothetical protein ANCCAN_30129 [Ancylostoma caninum]|uniref:Uncharacterized protein n=1 Tax=Ancylostoma caninum TaxID=29170 RepID=A0A368EWR2_ANCCA|nr:hypothetical protein ANCCAN_30129 [Ancylostoma caninum]